MVLHYYHLTLLSSPMQAIRSYAHHRTSIRVVHRRAPGMDSTYYPFMGYTTSFLTTGNPVAFKMVEYVEGEGMTLSVQLTKMTTEKRETSFLSI
jgi:hypothetical protein